MRKWIIAAVAVLALAGVVAALLLNANALLRRNRGYIIQQAEQTLGRKISVGELEATILSGLGVRLENFAISDDPAFSNEDFVRARDLQVNLKFWPLLQRQVEVKRLILHQPVVRIIRDAGGRYNFSTIGRSRDDKKAAERKSAQERPAAAEQLGVVVSLLDISGGDFHYVDRKERGDLRVSQLDLKVKDFSFNRPFSVDLAASVYADHQNVALSSRIGPIENAPSFADIPLDGELDIDRLDTDRLQRALPQLRRSLPKDLGLSGVLRVSDLKFRGSLNHLSLNGTVEGSNSQWRFGTSFQKPVGVPFTVHADARYDGSKLSLANTVVKLHTLELTGNGEVQLGDNKRLNLSIDAAPAALDGWDKLIPTLARYELTGKMGVRGKIQGNISGGAIPQIQGTLVLSDVRLKPPDFPQPIENIDAEVRFQGDKADISAMSLKLGRSKIDLVASIRRFNPLTVTYRLATPELYPADYKSALTKDRAGDVIRNLKSEGSFTLTGGDVTYDGRVMSAGGRLYNLAYKGLDTSLSIANKVAKVRSLRAELLDGSVQLGGEYSFHDQAPRVNAAATVRGIAIDELYAFLDPEAERDIRGRLNAEMKLSGSGATWPAIQPTLRGDGNAEVHKGALLNFNIAEAALSGITGIPGLTNLFSPALRQKYPETFAAKHTEFDELRGRFTVADSRLNINDLRIAAAEFTVQGSGWVDFKRRIEFPATLYFSRPLSSDLARSAREVKYLLNKQGQLEIPLTISGRLPNVKPRVDTKIFGGVAQRGFLQKGIEELQNQFLGGRQSRNREEAAPRSDRKTRQSAEEAIRKGLENLFRR